ncbi:MAG: hypothetical protein JKY71_07100 [Alphaproteobacteria bacterium]|nr:hypothetical protein [Alphaproteobacteria bacterium]
MTIRDVARRLASALHRDHSTLIQHYAVPYLEYTLQRELNSMIHAPEMQLQEPVQAGAGGGSLGKSGL